MRRASLLLTAGLLLAALALGGAPAGARIADNPLTNGYWYGEGRVTGSLSVGVATIAVSGAYRLGIAIHQNGNVIRAPTGPRPSEFLWNLDGAAEVAELSYTASARGSMEVRGTGARPTFAGGIPFAVKLHAGGRSGRIDGGRVKWVVTARIANIIGTGCRRRADIIDSHPNLTISDWSARNLNC